MNTILPKISYIFKTSKFILNKKMDEVYCFYPDMLIAAVLAKLINRKIKIYYEIQDLHSVNSILKLLHNIFMLFAEKIFLTSQLFIDEFKNGFKSLENKTIFIGNGPYVKLWKNYLGQKRRRDELTIGFVGMLRDFEHISNIKLILEKTNFNILQAGVNLYAKELNSLKGRYPLRLEVIEKYDATQLYSDLYPKIDVIWSSYPETRNYKLHVSRRFCEAIETNRAVVISKHAQGMNLEKIKEEHPYIYFFDQLINLDQEQQNEIKNLDLKWADSNFSFDVRLEKFLSEFSRE